MDLIKLKPNFISMIWGGHRLKDRFHFETPSATTGEAWVVSAHPKGDCEIAEGPYAGMKLSEFYQNHRDLFGKTTSESFPLLIKFIDAKDDLSVQVHPDDAYALKTAQSSGKTECWLVLDCDPEGEILIGHDFQHKDQMRQAMENGTIQHHLTRIKIKPGDFFYIPAGTVHAICKNTLIYEVQQNSDMTYRIDDYGRLDPSGKPRLLHRQDALEVTAFPHRDATVSPVVKTFGSTVITTYLNNDFFLIQKIDCGSEFELTIDEPYAILGCFDGNPMINGTILHPGDHALLLKEARTLKIQGPCSLMISVPKASIR